uniref:Putative secreted protein n=1 Tax=Ixodes ricinus TaxID=34613 RepID=A0A6B0U3E0_IXORI
MAPLVCLSLALLQAGAVLPELPQLALQLTAAFLARVLPLGGLLALLLQPATLLLQPRHLALQPGLGGLLQLQP